MKITNILIILFFMIFITIFMPANSAKNRNNIIIPYDTLDDYIDKELDKKEAINLIVKALQENEANKLSKTQDSFRPCCYPCNRCCKSQLNTP